MNTVKVPTRKGLGRVCVAALFALTVAACGDSQDVEASSPAGSGPIPTVEHSGEVNLAPETWLSSTPIDPSTAYVDGIDITGLMQLENDGPYGYEAGKAFGGCTVVYHAYGDGSFDVAIKPNSSNNASLPEKGVRIEGALASEVDPWIASYTRSCYAA